FSDVAHLAGSAPSHRVDRVSKGLPGACHSRTVRVATQPYLCTNFTGHARHFAGEPIQLIYHRVESFLELQDFAADIYCDLPRKVATRNRSCDFCNVSHLTRQVAGHEVHVIGEIFPSTAHTGHLRLPTKLTVGAH